LRVKSEPGIYRLVNNIVNKIKVQDFWNNKGDTKDVIVELNS
jgi:hypothetical protein